MGVYKRGNIWWIRYYDHGKEYYESSKSKKKEVAKALLKRREGEIEKGKLPGIHFDKVKFDELAEDFIWDRKINNRNVSEAEIRFKHLKGHFEGTLVTRITDSHIVKYIENRISEGAANATINRELAALKRMFNLGAHRRPPKVDMTQVPHIKMLKEDNVKKGFFEYDDYLIFLKALPEYLKGPVMFACKTAWREEEVISIEWKQVDLKEGAVRLEPGETKNGKGRTVYLDEELITMFSDLEKKRKETSSFRYVFLNRAGTGKIKDFRGAWNRACRETSLGYGYRKTKKYVETWEAEGFKKGPTIHDFRRSGVRNMVRSGVSEHIAMAISGHETRSVFDRYDIVSDADLKEAARKQDAYFGGLQADKE